MSEKIRLYLHFFEDILNAINKIELYINDISYDDFCEKPMIVDAIIRNFEIIGEAANKIPELIRDKYPTIEWREMTAFRNILIHNYFDIDVEAVWDTVKNNIPILKKHIMAAYHNEK